MNQYAVQLSLGGVNMSFKGMKKGTYNLAIIAALMSAVLLLSLNVGAAGVTITVESVVRDNDFSYFDITVDTSIDEVPDGTYAGAKATIQAIEAYYDGQTLEEKSKTHPELKKSLEKFGYIQPI